MFSKNYKEFFKSIFSQKMNAFVINSEDLFFFLILEMN